MIPILILAAGQSSRMRGSDKMLEDVGDVPLLRKQAQRALATEQPVFVALPHANESRSEVLRDLNLSLLHISHAEEGMSATLREAVPQLPTSKAFMVVLADLVELETSDLDTALNARNAFPDALIWRGATQDLKPGHPILFDFSLRVAFANLAGDFGARRIVSRHADKTVLVPLPGDRARRDLDTPEDWEAWRATQP